MKWRRLSRLEGMLLGALVELTYRTAITRDAQGPQAMCHRGLCSADECARCGPILRAKDLVDKVLAMQRKKPKPSRRGTQRPSSGGGRATSPPLNQNIHDHRFDEPLKGGR